MNLTIAVLLTCFNRQEKTLACLQALFAQILPENINLTVYLVDDGSTDGTREAITKTYPQVKLFYGDGNLYWNGGMRWAFNEAIKDNPDFYLWLNDDTLLYPEALKTLWETYTQLEKKGEEKAIIAACTCDPQTGEFTYGGVLLNHPFHPFKYEFLKPTDSPQKCDTMNGNCVLIPRCIVQLIGNLDEAFVHYIGDWDYGLRAKKAGGSVWIAPGYLATCSANLKPGRHQGVDLSKGLEKTNQPKGLVLEDETLQPIGEWKVFTKRHGGWLWPVFWLLPYRRLLWLSLLHQLGLQK